MDGLNLVDSSGWIEYFTDGPNASRFAGPLSDAGRLIVPTVSIYEVFRVVLRRRGEDDALRVAPCDSALGLDADPRISSNTKHKKLIEFSQTGAFPLSLPEK